MKFDLKKFLQNQTVLYVTLFLSVTSLLGYIVSRNTEAVVLFVLVCFVVSYFSKNMTVILLSGLVLTNFGMGIRRSREGLENKEDGDDEEEEGEEEGDEEEDEVKQVKMVKKEQVKQPKKAAKKANNASAKSDDSAVIRPNAEVDKKKTKELAYSNFEKALGHDGVLKLSGDMDKMVDRHEKLQKTIENMAPILNKAQDLLERVNIGNFGGVMDKLMGFVEKST